MASFERSNYPTRAERQRNDSHWLLKMLALVILLLCAAIGMVGLILPIIPGLLFLAIAALITARMFPGLARRLRRNATLAGYLDSSDGFLRLNLRDKCQYALWLSLRVLIDTAKLLHTLVTKALVLAARRPGT